jgi:hypothetical protein
LRTFVLNLCTIRVPSTSVRYRSGGSRLGRWRAGHSPRRMRPVEGAGACAELSGRRRPPASNAFPNHSRHHGGNVDQRGLSSPAGLSILPLVGSCGPNTPGPGAVSVTEPSPYALRRDAMMVGSWGYTTSVPRCRRLTGLSTWAVVNLDFAWVAQSVEQRTRNAQVVGSNPTSGSKRSWSRPLVPHARDRATAPSPNIRAVSSEPSSTRPSAASSHTLLQPRCGRRGRRSLADWYL